MYVRVVQSIHPTQRKKTNSYFVQCLEKQFTLFINPQSIYPSSHYYKIQTAQGTSQNTFYHSGPVTVFYNILALFEPHLALVT